MNNIKCQNLVTFSFKIRTKHYFHYLQQYFHYFIACILVSYAFWFSYQQNKVTILIIAEFRGTAVIRGEEFIRGRHLFQYGFQKMPALIEGGAYLRRSASQRKYGDHCYGQVESVILDRNRNSLITKPGQTRLFTLSSWFVQRWYLDKNKCPNFIKVWLVLATMLESLAECLTELCASDFY